MLEGGLLVGRQWGAKDETNRNGHTFSNLCSTGISKRGETSPFFAAPMIVSTNSGDGSELVVKIASVRSTRPSASRGLSSKTASTCG